MSKRINVNPDHYKVAGRERQGEGVVRTPKAKPQDTKARERWERQTRARRSQVKG